MKKIRINELARELEVKPGVIIDMLPELGVQEKKTHSSSIDEEVAIELKRRLNGPDSGPLRTGSSESANGHGHDHDYDDHSESREEDREHEPQLHQPAEAVSEQTVVRTQAVGQTPVLASEPPAPPKPPPSLPLRPPALPLRPARDFQTARPPLGVHKPVAHPPPPPPPPPAPAAKEEQAVVEAAEQTANTEATDTEKPVPTFRPLRPPIGGSAIHPPLASPGHAVNRGISIPARPVPPSPRVNPAGSTAQPSGPRQPLPVETPRSNFSPLAPQDRPARPAPPVPPSPVPPPPAAPSRMTQVPTHLVAPGPGSAHPPQASNPSPAVPAPPSAVPSAPIPARPTPSAPAHPRHASSPGLTPGAPIAPRPQGSRPLAGQPQPRPVVLPRPDLVERLKQQQQTQTRPMPGTAAPPPPRPGAPSRPSPAPGQPLYRGPVRPGQPLMRGPGQPGGGGGGGYNPGSPGQQQRRPGGPGVRPMHPTSLRPDQAQPMPTPDTRRHQAKPGTRQPLRKREDQEGNLRDRGPKRQAIFEPPPIDREITVAEGVTVKELSEKLGVKANLVIKKLLEKKVFATINQTLDVKLAEDLAREFGASTNKVTYEEESTQDIVEAEETGDLVRRAPVVTIMGHVDHGKTSLLDAIRETNVAGREAGGITQHIGAYHVEKNGRKIVFIDTPGHQAFTRMRARGAKVTDIVVLVVSADDGVMPQTLEAIDHARAAGVPMIVAINKIDKPGAQIDRVKQQLSDRGMLAEDWGGDVVMVPVSAKAKQNLDLLLEMILLVADMQDLKANPGRPAVGTVLEAKLDKGRGPVATMLVRNGTLKVGDQFICGALFSKVRAMFDDRGNPTREAEPSMPVEVIGLESVPEVGDSFQVVTDTSKAKQIVVYREAKARDAAMLKGARVATLDSLHQQFKEGDLKDLNLVIKADVGGTAEVLSDTLQQLSTDKIRVRILRAGVGAITEDDVLLASASEALIIGFNVKAEKSAESVADQQKIAIRLHSIIYELIDEVRLAMTGLLDPVYKETILGHAEVREVFKISKVGTVAGCYVSDGAIRRDSQVRIKRDGDLIHTGKIEALKRFKNDASEVKNGLECGISIVNFNNINTGDIIEAFTMERIAPQLTPPPQQAATTR